MIYTLANIIKIVDDSKDFTPDEQTNLARSLPILVCSLYILHMELRHNIKVII